MNLPPIFRFLIVIAVTIPANFLRAKSSPPRHGERRVLDYEYSELCELRASVVK
jgi:hypothetical protein